MSNSVKKKTWILYLILAAALMALALYARGRIHFNWGVFATQLRLADWRMIGLGVLLISFGYVVRAVRWVLFLKPAAKIPLFSRNWFHVLGAQVIGYTGVALIGRAADLMRPYLVSRRLKLPLSSQVAVYVVERMFDLGTMALLFSSVLLFAPDRATLPDHEKLKFLAEFGLAGTAGLAVLATAVRMRGRTIAAMAERIIGRLSEGLAASVAAKINSFRDGLEMLGSLRDVFSALLLSLLMWGLITFAYLVSIRAFVDSPQLRSLTLAQCIVLMAAGMVVSVFQLPVVGWFTQIGGLTVLLQLLFGAAWEPALGCSAVLLIVTFLSVVPTGLIWARVDQVSFRKVTKESGAQGNNALATEAISEP